MKSWDRFTNDVWSSPDGLRWTQVSVGHWSRQKPPGANGGDMRSWSIAENCGSSEELRVPDKRTPYRHTVWLTSGPLRTESLGNASRRRLHGQQNFPLRFSARQYLLTCLPENFGCSAHPDGILCGIQRTVGLGRWQQSMHPGRNDTPAARRSLTAFFGFLEERI